MRDLGIVSLKELLPSSVSSDTDVLAAAEAIDAELRKATQLIPGVSILPRLREIANSTILNLLAWQFHVDFYDPAMPLELRRSLVVRALDWHTRKGTPSAVEEVVTAVFSDATVEEWWEWGGEPYWFRVTTADPIEDESVIAALVEAIWSVKNTRSWLDGIHALKSFHPAMYVGARQYCIEDDTIGLRNPDKSVLDPVYVGVGVVIRMPVSIECEEPGEIHLYGVGGYGENGYGGNF